MVSSLLLGSTALAWRHSTLGRARQRPTVDSIASLATYHDTELLAKASALPVAATYRAKLEYQHNCTFCGPASIVNVLHSLERTASQGMVLEGTRVGTWFGYLPSGMTLDELSEVAQNKVGRRVTVLRDLSLAAFREHLRRSNEPTRRYIANFSRTPLFGAGDGHLSPIGGFLVEDDLVLVLDVNPTYGPWLVASQRLHAAISTTD